VLDIKYYADVMIQRLDLPSKFLTCCCFWRCVFYTLHS